ncbi:MAG TPA: DUF3611 family protein [Synechococcales cyanobacterium M55_K2018_004]|nr:DUF3611 family protein [Synechococcales cyanobacterium M55_K2018_004]
MMNFLDPAAPSPTPQEIARSFRWLGWGGFWLQALLGFIPILVVLSSVLFRPARQTNFFSFGLWLAIICAVVLVFSAYWCFHYTQIARKLKSPDLRPAKSEVLRDLKIGVVANFSIMAIAVIIALSRVGGLTIKMLSMPQGATVIMPNQLGTTINPGALITPSNMIAIQAMINAIAAGLVGAIVSLLLIHQVGQHRNS